MDASTSIKRKTSHTTGLGPAALSTATAVTSLPTALASTGLPSNAHAAKKIRVTDRQLPEDLASVVPESRMLSDLQAFEKKLDATILRKRLEVQEAKGSSFATQRTLRIFVSNLVANQAHQLDDEPADPTADAKQSTATTLAEAIAEVNAKAVLVPSWTLRIEGRLLELPYSKKPTVGHKFTSFFESIVVELLRDPKASATDPTPAGTDLATQAQRSQVTEWRRSGAQPDTDGLEIKRTGDVDVPVRIVLTPRTSVHQFQLSCELAYMLGLTDQASQSATAQTSGITMTKLQVITQVWHYVRQHKLQDAVDPQRIHSNEPMQRVFGVQDWSFPLVSHLLRPHLLPPPPAVIHYTVQVRPDDGGQQTAPQVYDLQVDFDDLMRSRGFGYHRATHVHSQISRVDDQLTTLIRAIQNSQQKRRFLQGFAEDPARFIHRWTAAQARELDTIAQERSDLSEVARKSKYFQDSWVDEAVLYYLSTQSQNQA
ncbi:SWI/SNF and RSC complex subunit Ssr3 [Dimargaris verticillata]|uniref:SWI/SNF and RSC complex subunit Ssr3 n=1 Tax=Dimargaris verticillata TaxID=2761393 RepID=A0A9W8B662_9FUNG|nr:SWI/SNF and RSC complex subunit Ssr3 [Dimargaris verticillata]